MSRRRNSDLFEIQSIDNEFNDPIFKKMDSKPEPQGNQNNDGDFINVRHRATPSIGQNVFSDNEASSIDESNKKNKKKKKEDKKTKSKKNKKQDSDDEEKTDKSTNEDKKEKKKKEKKKKDKFKKSQKSQKEAKETKEPEQNNSRGLPLLKIPFNQTSNFQQISASARNSHKMLILPDSAKNDEELPSPLGSHHSRLILPSSNFSNSSQLSKINSSASQSYFKNVKINPNDSSKRLSNRYGLFSESNKNRNPFMSSSEESENESQNNKKALKSSMESGKESPLYKNDILLEEEEEDKDISKPSSARSKNETETENASNNNKKPKSETESETDAKNTTETEDEKTENEKTEDETGDDKKKEKKEKKKKKKKEKDKKDKKVKKEKIEKKSKKLQKDKKDKSDEAANKSENEKINTENETNSNDESQNEDKKSKRKNKKDKKLKKKDNKNKEESEIILDKPNKIQTENKKEVSATTSDAEKKPITVQKRSVEITQNKNTSSDTKSEHENQASNTESNIYTSESETTESKADGKKKEPHHNHHHHHKKENDKKDEKETEKSKLIRKEINSDSDSTIDIEKLKESTKNNKNETDSSHSEKTKSTTSDTMPTKTISAISNDKSRPPPATTTKNSNDTSSEKPNPSPSLKSQSKSISPSPSSTKNKKAENSSTEYLVYPFPDFESSSSSTSDDNDKLDIVFPDMDEFKPKTLSPKTRSNKDHPQLTINTNTNANTSIQKASLSPLIQKPPSTRDRARTQFSMPQNQVQFAPPAAKKMVTPHVQLNGKMMPPAQERMPDLISPLAVNSIIDSKSDSMVTSADLVKFSNLKETKSSSRSFSSDDKINLSPTSIIKNSPLNPINKMSDSSQPGELPANMNKKITSSPSPEKIENKKEEEEKKEIDKEKVSDDDKKDFEPKMNDIDINNKKDDDYKDMPEMAQMKRAGSHLNALPKLPIPKKPNGINTLSPPPQSQQKPYPLNNTRERSGSEHWNEYDFSSDNSDDDKNLSLDFIRNRPISMSVNQDMHNLATREGLSVVESETRTNPLSDYGNSKKNRANAIASNSVSNFNLGKPDNSSLITKRNKVPSSAQKITDNKKKIPKWSQSTSLTRFGIRKEKIHEFFATPKTLENYYISVNNDDIDKYMDAAEAQLRKTFTIPNIDDKSLEATKWQLTEKANAAEKSYNSLNENMKDLEKEFESASEAFENAQSKVQNSNEKIKLVEKKLNELSSKIGEDVEVKEKITDFLMISVLTTFTLIIWLYYTIRRFAMSFYVKSDQLPHQLSLKEVGHRVENIRNKIDKSREIEADTVE